MTINKIFITGASGFIGSHLCAYFKNINNYKVISYHERLPLSPQLDSQLSTLLEKEKPQFIIHCAGSSSVAHSFSHPQEDFHNNVIATESLLSTIAKSSPQSKLIYLSSAAVYGNPKNFPIDENTPTNPISPYGYHKLMCEQICKKYYFLYNIPVAILRIFSVYGPGLKKQILWDIYQKNSSNTSVFLQGTGKETRDFIYIDDLMKAINKVLCYRIFNANIINVATGKTITVSELAGIMLSRIKSTKKLEFSGINKDGDPLQWAVNINTLQKMDMSQWTPIEEGIQQYINWLSRTKDT